MADDLENSLLQSGAEANSDTQKTNNNNGTDAASSSSNSGCTDLQKMIEEAVSKVLQSKGMIDEEQEEELQEDEVLDDLDQFSDVGPDIAGSVKELVFRRCTELLADDVLHGKMKKHARPSNLNLVSPKVNPEIWTGLPMYSRARDKK